MVFKDKQSLLKESEEAKKRINVSKIGLVSWKYHSFLKPEENRELQQLTYVNIQQAIIDSIHSTVEALVVRNTMSDWDYLKESEDNNIVFNRKVDSDRKTHIIYGVGNLDGDNNKNKLTVILNDGELRNQKDYTPFGNEEYFHKLEPMVVLRRHDNADFIFDKPGNYKLYGMTTESLGAHVCG